MSDFSRLILIFLVFLLVRLNPAYAQNNDDLQKLLAPFAETKHLKLGYQEKRFSLFFKQPQIYYGYIEYIPPDTFIKQVQDPIRKKIVITGEQLTIYNDDSQTQSERLQKQSEKKVVALADYPRFKQLKALFSGLFKGHAAQISTYYQYKIESLADKKTRLRLTPHIINPFTQDESQNVSIHQQIDIVFQHNRILSITMTGLGGERSELMFIKEVLQQNNEI